MHNLDRVLGPQQMFNEMEFENGPFGAEFESDGEGAMLNEEALAAELLTVSNEEELEQFLGGLIKKAASGISSFAKSSAGKALGGVLKQVAKTALPTVGGALGSLIPIPGVGTAVGTMAGKALASALEFETGLSAEDREFEVAKQVVRLAGDAARTAAQAPAGANPAAVAMQAVKTAMQGAGASASAGGAQAQSGRWVRRGRHIVLLGV
jgi:hypothetical protein